MRSSSVLTFSVRLSCQRGELCPSVWSVAFVLAFPRFLFSVLSAALSIVRLCTSFTLSRATHNSISASLDWEDVALSSGEAISSVATTVSVSQPVFTISSETLSQAFLQACGQWPP